MRSIRGKSGPNSGKHTQRILLASSAALQTRNKWSVNALSDSSQGVMLAYYLPPKKYLRLSPGLVPAAAVSKANDESDRGEDGSATGVSVRGLEENPMWW
jgi:hypothetical protein